MVVVALGVRRIIHLQVVLDIGIVLPELGKDALYIVQYSDSRCQVATQDDPHLLSSSLCN